MESKGFVHDSIRIQNRHAGSRWLAGKTAGMEADTVCICGTGLPFNAWMPGCLDAGGTGLHGYWQGPGTRGTLLYNGCAGAVTG